VIIFILAERGGADIDRSFIGHVKGAEGVAPGTEEIYS